VPDIVSLPIVIDPDAVAPLVELPYVIVVAGASSSFEHEINTKGINNKVNENIFNILSSFSKLDLILSL